MSNEKPDDSFDEMTPAWHLHGEDGSVSPTGSSEESDLSTQELEQLYQQALNAVEMADAVESQLGLKESAAAPKPAAEAAKPVPPAETSNTTTRSKVQPRQILEAALFVGGTDLTTKKLGRLLGEETPGETVEAEIEALNHRYASQNRPYQILFGEGGYRLELHSEFERIRNRVYGLGPKEVKLSQEALEVLAMVAYQQPVTREQLIEKGPRNVNSLLNQLLRRELIRLERTGESRKDVQYSTTERFLQVFGITDLQHLPQPDDLTFK